MSDFDAGVRLPHKIDDYRIEAFYDDETPGDVPDLHIRIGELHGHPLDGVSYFSQHGEIIVRMDSDWTPDDHREFWNRLKAEADKALARIDEVERAGDA